ncbi:hypothetical protein PFISCL1PPCAC_8621 [Pristionchus fissidentatus]|uniref:Fatty-acid and retinol-binding protein 1 n=1 Tax=Pristionchus fissidentatus TaxID=1538716 RepID=A0AAV5VFV5_9BILA|nr:hypothetical protein PFISCL1PPCAC_8621 [Pristionchus fissidentatus]
MLRSVALLAFVAAVALAAPFNSIDDVPAEYKDLIPAQAKEFLTGLTEDDKKILKEVAANYASYKSEDEAMAALKEKSPALFEKAEKLHNLLKSKIDLLGEEAKKFAKEIIGEARAIQAAVVSGTKPTLEELKAKVLSGVEKYKALSAEAKADLEKQFPITATVFKNEKFQELAKKLLAKN